VSHPAYPLDSDVAAFVANSGVQMPTGYVYAGYAASAALEWERMTGWVPFLQDASATARTFDPPGNIQQNRSSYAYYGGARVLNLGAALMDASALVSITGPNNPFVINQDFRLAPVNAPSNKRPYSRIEFTYPQWGTFSTFVITAKWGFTNNLPEDVWQAIIRIGAGMAMDDMVQAIDTSFKSVKQGDETFSQNDDPNIGMAWKAYAQRIASNYEMVTVAL